METTYTSSAPAICRTAAPIESLRTRIRQYRVYRRTMSELSGLSDRALADLGLSRAMIKAVAREAAFGA